MQVVDASSFNTFYVLDTTESKTTDTTETVNTSTTTISDFLI